MATLVAALLSLSSLGQTAHFLLVPHAVCVEHGELLELSEADAHGAVHAESGSDDEPAATSQPAAEHDHCQVLARGQREQAVPPAPSADLLPAAAAEARLLIARQDALLRTLPSLSFAPKTSPPSALVG